MYSCRPSKYSVLTVLPSTVGHSGFPSQSRFPNNKTVLFSLCILFYCRAILITRVLSTIVRCLGGSLSTEQLSQRGPSSGKCNGRY